MAMARIVLGITGGIAAYKACEIIRLLVQAGMTCCRCRRAAPSGSSPQRRSTRSPARRAPTDPYPHLQRADLFVVAPLTAHTMARLAHGLADDTLTEAVLAHDGPILVAPAMNTRMWQHPATRANHELLLARGVEVVGPASGELAEGEVGVGRMAEPEEIVARAEAMLAHRARSSTSTCSSPRVGPASRSTQFGTSATAPRAGWASPLPTRHASGVPA